MKRQSRKKQLKLKKEVLKSLLPKELERVAGGDNGGAGMRSGCHHSG